MSRSGRVGLLLAWTLAAWAAFVPTASAYVDAGSTSVIFQAIIAFLAAAGTGLAMFRQKIAGLLRRGKATEPVATEAANSEPEGA